MFNNVFNMEIRHVVATGFMLFPVCLSAISMAGFALGVAIGKWTAAMALVLTLVVVGLLSPTKRLCTVLWTVSGIIASVCLAGVFVMYTNADAEAYHRPAAVLLANGWNPLKMTEPADLMNIVGGGRRPWCVAFIPRMAWILGASLYHWIGFVEASDALNILMLFSSAIFVYDWLRGFIGTKLMVAVFTTLVCFSPEVVYLLWGGSMDAAWYSAFTVAMICAARKEYLPMVLSMLVMSGVKFTGVVASAIIFAAFGFAALLWERRELWRLTKIGFLAGALIVLINASPYITSAPPATAVTEPRRVQTDLFSVSSARPTPHHPTPQ